MTEKLQQVVRRADDPPLGFHPIQTAECKAPQAANSFDVADHWFNNGLPLAIQRAPASVASSARMRCASGLLAICRG